MSRMDVIEAATDAAVDRISTAGLLVALRSIDAMRAELGFGMKPALFDHILSHPHCQMADLIRAIYPNPNNEPDYPVVCIKAQLSHMRKRLAPHGYTIEGKAVPEGRYRLRALA